MTILAIDTATEYLSVALVTTEGTRAVRTFQEPRAHATQLVSAVDALLLETGTALPEISEARLVDGPGSFTGLRVGASVVKGLFSGTSVRCRTASSLLVNVTNSADPVGMVLSVATAGRSGLFAAWYSFDGELGVVHVVRGPTLTEWGALYTSTRVPSKVVLGGGVVVSPKETVPGSWVGAEWSQLRHEEVGEVGATSLLGLDKWTGALTDIDDIDRWEPFYGQAPTAQVVWEKHHGRSLPNTRAQFE